MKLPEIPAVLKQEAVIAGGIVVGVIVLALVLKKYGASIGKAAGEGAVNTAAGVVLGVGSGIGLPDTSDASVVAAGRNAFDRGDYLEASAKLPAPELLDRVGRAFGRWIYDSTHADVNLATMPPGTSNVTFTDVN